MSVNAETMTMKDQLYAYLINFYLIESSPFSHLISLSLSLSVSLSVCVYFCVCVKGYLVTRYMLDFLSCIV
jgi:hypothetical protein